MTQRSRATLKTYFEGNDIPTETQYADLIDSAYNLTDDTAEDLTINSLQMETSPTGITPVEGLLYWNDTDKTLNIGLPGGSILQVGEENVVYAKNETGSTITDGSVVYASGATGTNLTMALADGSDFTKCAQVGVVTQDILNNAFGFVTTFGFVRDVDTTGGAESWSVLDALYVSPTTPGALTNVVPSTPNFTTPIGIVTKVHATQGVIGVNPDWPKATNTSLGTSNVVAATQGAVKAYVDTSLTQYVEMGVEGLTDADATPSVSTKKTVYTFSAGTPYTVTALDDGTLGQVLSLVNMSSVIVTLKHGTLVGENLVLTGGSNFAMDQSDAIQFVYAASDTWVETGRSVK